MRWHLIMIFWLSASIVIRDWSFPRFFRVVVETEEDAVGVPNVGDPMPVSRGPHVLLHELRELRIVFQFRHGLPVDPELSRRGEDFQLFEPLQGLRDVFHANLKVVQGFAREVWSPERTAFRVPIQFHSLPERRSRSRTYLPSSSPPRSISSRSNTLV